MARELSMVENNAQVLISLNSCQAWAAQTRQKITQYQSK
jgi:hypothetical protein